MSGKNYRVVKKRIGNMTFFRVVPSTGLDNRAELKYNVFAKRYQASNFIKKLKAKK